MKPKTLLFAFLGLLTLLRLWLTQSVELAPDESYYHLWSLHPDVCYFSKGPGVAFAIKLGTLFRGPTEAGIRFLCPLLTLATSLLVYGFARRMYSEHVAFWAALGMNFLPILQAGSVLMTIDPLSIFFWTASMYAFWLALEHSSSRDDGTPGAGWSFWWPVTGVLVGLGFLCKWVNAMQLVSIVAVLVSGNRFRRHFRQPGFWTMLLVFCIFLAPPLLWNVQHEWVSFTHVADVGGLRRGFGLSLSEVFSFLGSQLAVYSPLLFLAMLATLWREWPRARDHFKPRFLLAFTVPLFGLHLLLSFNKAAHPNWTAPAMVSLLILAAADWLERARASFRARVFLSAGFAVGLLLSVLILNTDMLRHAGIPFPYARDPGKRLRGWQTTAEAVEKVRGSLEKELGQPLFLIASGRAMASNVGFYLKDPRLEGPDHPPIYTPETQAIEDQFSLWPRYDEFIPLKPGQKPLDPLYTEEGGFNPFFGRSALFITESPQETPPTAITGGFEKTILWSCVDIERMGQTLRQVRIFLCTNYSGRAL